MKSLAACVSMRKSEWDTRRIIYYLLIKIIKSNEVDVWGEGHLIRQRKWRLASNLKNIVSIPERILKATCISDLSGRHGLW